KYAIQVSKANWNDIEHVGEDRKSTRLNSSHVEISYAVFCLKKKKKKKKSNNETRQRRIQCLHRERAGSPGVLATQPLKLPATEFKWSHVVIFFFFFKGSGPPGNLPFSPPRPSPD